MEGYGCLISGTNQAFIHIKLKKKKLMKTITNLNVVSTDPTKIQYGYYTNFLL